MTRGYFQKPVIDSIWPVASNVNTLVPAARCWPSGETAIHSASTIPWQCRIAPFFADLEEDQAAAEVDRPALLKAFRAYLQANDLEADWESVSRAENGMLVNALSMMAPYGPAEKQALLEAADLKTRAETLIAITEITLAREDEDGRGRVGLQLFERLDQV